MEGFIELTLEYGNVNVLLPLSQIHSIYQNDDGSVFIETGFNEKKGSTGFNVKETYEEIRRKIAKLILFS